MLIVSENSPRGRKARAARKWFANNGPPDLPPLPLGYNERERLKHGGADHILAWYARSLDDRNYDVLKHPSFHDYARGVMASEFAPDFIKEDGELKKRFPPRPLAGLGPGLQWLPTKQHAEAIQSLRRCQLPPKEYAKTIADLRRSRGFDLDNTY
jgi:hypothetical protein